MTPQQRLELEDVARDNSHLNAMLQLWDRSAVTYDEWAHMAIVILANSGTEYREVATDALMRRPMPPLMVTA